MQIYIAGPLSGLSSVELEAQRKMYEAIAGMCSEAGLHPYVPHRVSDPVRAVHLTPKEVDELDRTAVLASSMLISYIGIPSVGAGIEIEIAHHANIPILLLYEASKFKSRLISRLARGNPGVVKEIVFETLDGIKTPLTEFLKSYFRHPDKGQPARELPRV